MRVGWSALLLLAVLLCSPPQRLSLSAKQQPLLYTLHSGDGASIGDPSTANWIVGPSAARRKIEANMLRREHDLKRAREEHQLLVERASSLEAAAHPGPGDMNELAALKKQKLRAKDAIARLSRLVSGAQQTPLLVELGEGGFGKVLFGKSSSGVNVAVKISGTADSSSLFKESLALSRLRGHIGFPTMHFYGEQSLMERGPHVVLVQELLGPSVEKLYFFTTLGTRGFTSATVLLLAAQLLERLELLAQFRIIHGDVQPGNFLMGRGDKNNTVHLIDFGLASLASVEDVDLLGAFRGALAPKPASDCGLRGTLVFSSVQSMLGQRLHERDDLESLAYSLAYLLCNKLPWSDSCDGESDAEAVERVLNSKRSCPVSSVCVGHGENSVHAAGAIVALLTHARELGSCERPDFKRLQDVVAAALAAETSSPRFEWIRERITWCTPDGSLRHELY